MNTESSINSLPVGTVVNVGSRQNYTKMQGRGYWLKNGSSHGWKSASEIADMLNAKVNPHGLQIGDWVTLPPRADGIPHRHGNDAIWEVIELTDIGLVTLHLVGGSCYDTCGSFAVSVIPSPALTAP